MEKNYDLTPPGMVSNIRSGKEIIDYVRDNKRLLDKYTDKPTGEIFYKVSETYGWMTCAKEGVIIQGWISDFLFYEAGGVITHRWYH